MKDPSAAGDSDGEWFEVYNSTGSAIDMGGWSVSDGGSNAFTVQDAFVIPPRACAVFCINADSATNGGMFAPLMYDWGTSGTFTLGNTDDKIIIKTGEVLIDSISYDGGASWPDPTGASLGLADFSTDNNAGENWTPAQSRQPAYHGFLGDLGSPGTLGDNQTPGSGPSIFVDPDSLEITLGVGEVTNKQLLIANIGAESLTWSGQVSDCSWLTIPQPTGEIPPGDTTMVRIRFSPGTLAAGDYACVITIESNDELFPLTMVHVVLHVVDVVLEGAISIPDEFLPVPSEGDSVGMNIDIKNLSGIRRQVDVWITLLRPGEPEPRQLIDSKEILLSPFEVISRTRMLHILAHSPAGTYALTLHLGAYPDSVLSSSTFLFEKESAYGTGSAGYRISGIPSRSFLDQSYPSPFNAATTILYGLSEDTWVTLKVYDMIGREVATLVNEFQFAGYRSVSWNGRKHTGEVSASGIYLCRMNAGGYSGTRTLMLLK
jgi:hypothetical protein